MNFINQIEGGRISIGIACAFDIDAHTYPPTFSTELTQWLSYRKQPLSEKDESIRKAVRDVLRNGNYKPTGRGKPANEYLIRAVHEENFPKINAPVDINNLISIKYLLPISLWDLELAGADDFLFRLGQPGETYIFNSGGQEIGLQDLPVGCALFQDHPGGIPIVNPVKDSLKTKTLPETRHVAAAIYAPSQMINNEELFKISSEFATLLGACGNAARYISGIVSPEGQFYLSRP
ncbi:MAG TPA: phenylalanine--tRNA ligase beta subunit-related protein [Rhodothermales bacterium]|nr:phenylalanine--tRNA ligase beta subunit-related protein [Rhodothermales bacterium]